MSRIVLATILFSIVFSLVSIIRHNHYFSQGQDLAIFTQTAWLYSNNLTPYNTITNKLDYHDRYKPVMLMIGFIYRIWRDPALLLIIQGSALSISGYYIYKISRYFKLSENQSFLIFIHYLMFPGITSFIIDDFHEVALYPLFFTASLYYYFKKSNILFTLSLVLSLMIREHLTVFTFVFWLSLYVLAKPYRNKLSSQSLLICTTLVIAMIVLIQLLGGISYNSLVHENDSFTGAITYLLTHPLQTVSSLFYPFEKTKTLSILSSYYIFLPFINLHLAPVILLQLAGRFLDAQHPYRWTVVFHYSGELAAILTYGTILTLSKLSPKKRQLLLASMFIMTLIYSKLLHSPIFLLTKINYIKQEPWVNNINNILKEIPPNASVSTQNNLAPHLANRQKLYILPAINDAQYIVMDLRVGQDQFNFYTLTYNDMHDLQEKISNDYQLISNKGDVYLYKKFANTQTL